MSESAGETAKCLSVYASYSVLGLTSLVFLGYEMTQDRPAAEYEGSFWWLVLVGLDGGVFLVGLSLGLRASFMDPGFHLKRPEGNQEALAALTETPTSSAAVFGDRTDDWAAQGRLSAGWTPGSRSVFVRNLNISLNYCQTCHIVRPPRTSHCRICDHCVEGKDHHCPWLRNCIGKRNYAYFLGFLIVVMVHLVLSVGFIIAVLILRSGEVVSVVWMLAAAVGAVELVGIWGVGRLFSFHAAYVTRAITTKEDIELPSFHSIRFQESNPYSSGRFCSNWLNVLCCPQAPSFADYEGRQSVPDCVMTGESGRSPYPKSDSTSAEASSSDSADSDYSDTFVTRL